MSRRRESIGSQRALWGWLYAEDMPKPLPRAKNVPASEGQNSWRTAVPYVVTAVGVASALFGLAAEEWLILTAIALLVVIVYWVRIRAVALPILLIVTFLAGVLGFQLRSIDRGDATAAFPFNVELAEPDEGWVTHDPDFPQTGTWTGSLPPGYTVLLWTRGRSADGDWMAYYPQRSPCTVHRDSTLQCRATIGPADISRQASSTYEIIVSAVTSDGMRDIERRRRGADQWADTSLIGYEALPQGTEVLFAQSNVVRMP